MPEEFVGYEDQIDDIINYSGLSLEDIENICNAVKEFYKTATFSYTPQNIIDTIQFTAEIIISDREINERRQKLKLTSDFITLQEAIYQAVDRIFQDEDFDLYDKNSINL